MVLILVAGLGEEVGKTVFAASLVEALRREGLDAAPFKPVGASDPWLHPEILEETRRYAGLVTWDAHVLASTVGLNPLLVNPVGGYIVWVDPFRGDSSVRGVLDSRIVLLRVTGCTGGSARSVHLLDEDSLSRAPASIRGLISEALEAINPSPLSVSREGIERILGEPAAEAADSCLKPLLSTAEAVVAESNSDVAVPTRSMAEPDLVVVVSRGVAAVYQGDRWRLALMVLAPIRPWQLSTRDVVKLLEPMKVLDIPVTTTRGTIPLEAFEWLVEHVKTIAPRS